MTEKNLPNVLIEVIDCFFLIDIILRFFIALRKPDGTLISNRKAIAIAYLKYPLNFENKKINFQIKKDIRIGFGCVTSLSIFFRRNCYIKIIQNYPSEQYL